jgi:hypothetical protein
MKRKKLWLAIATVSLTVICLAVIIFGVYGYIKLSSRIRILEGQATQPVSDLQAAIDFMKDQMQHLIWLLGVIVAGAGAILAFFGLTTRKSVDEKYELMYSKLIAAKDTEVFKKKIVFLHKDNDSNLNDFQNEIRGRGYNINVMRASTSTLNATSKLCDASIVVYRVPNENDSLYQGIADWCESNNVHCILYCQGIRLADDFMQKNLLFVSTSIQIAKLRESLYTLLYLAP